MRPFLKGYDSQDPGESHNNEKPLYRPKYKPQGSVDPLVAFGKIGDMDKSCQNPGRDQDHSKDPRK